LTVCLIIGIPAAAGLGGRIGRVIR
jgi:hypothetical protein